MSVNLTYQDLNRLLNTHTRNQETVKISNKTITHTHNQETVKISNKIINL